MARRAANKGGVGGFLERCVIFWVAPVIFLTSIVLDMHGSERPHVLLDVAPTFAALVGVSSANFATGCFCRYRRSFAGLQFLLQLIIAAAHCISSRALVYNPAAIATKLRNIPVHRARGPGAEGAAATASLVAATGAGNGGKLGPALGPPGGAGEAERISVVLPCLNETWLVEKTVRRFCERTPDDVLQEIIVVDDGSSPPLEEELARAGIEERCRLRVLRHKRAWGLMIAKQTGGDAATGKYIGFFDCHVAPIKGWYKEILQKLQASPRRLVVPNIGDLDLETYDEKHNGALTAKCYINFNADFWWYDDDSDNIPVISGGLVVTSRAWWWTSGGFDSGMRGWGGENTDQSLRAWLCGGDVVRAKSSHIAHMWRVPSDKRTIANYRLPGQTDNLARVAAIWFDEFQPKFRNSGHLVTGLNVSEALSVRRRLQCKPFVYFLHRFRRIYMDGGILPDKVFRIRSVEHQKCLQRHGRGYALKECAGGTWFHLANQIPKNLFIDSGSMVGDNAQEGGAGDVRCGAHRAPNCAACPQGHGSSWCHEDCIWNFGACVLKKNFKKRLQAAGRRKCCSGIREWNSLDCFDKLEATGPMAYSCDLAGGNQNQQYILGEDGRIRHQSGQCVGLSAAKKVVSVDCDGAVKWETIQGFVPEETKLYKQGVERYHLPDDGPDH